MNSASRLAYELAHETFLREDLKMQVLLGAIHKLRHTNFMIFLPLPVLVTGGHISENPST